MVPLFFLANSPGIARERRKRGRERKACSSRYTKVTFVFRQRSQRNPGCALRSRRMRCFKKRKGVNANSRARGWKTGRKGAAAIVVVGPCLVWNNGDVGTGDYEKGVAEQGSELQARSRIFHMQGACFAWPRQYYYHIFHIMRPRVCLLFHAASNHREKDHRGVKRKIEPGPATGRLNVLSFIARAAAFYGGYKRRGHPRWKVYTPWFWLGKRRLLGLWRGCEKSLGASTRDIWKLRFFGRIWSAVLVT